MKEEIMPSQALVEFDVKKPNGSEALAVTPQTPFELMAQSIRQGITAEQLQILQEMHFKQMAWEAEIEFNEALNRVQKQIPRVVPDLMNPQTNSPYASFAAVDAAVRPIYTGEGFSLSFNTCDSPKTDHVRVLAYLSRGKHTRPYQIDMPIVTTGIQGKAMMTLTHASAAANSYGKRYLECDIFNIPIGPDTDGNGAQGGGLTDERFVQLCDGIKGCNSQDELKAVYQAACKQASAVNDQAAMREFNKAKNTRYKELANAGR